MAFIEVAAATTRWTAEGMTRKTYPMVLNTAFIVDVVEHDDISLITLSVPAVATSTMVARRACRLVEVAEPYEELAERLVAG